MKRRTGKLNQRQGQPTLLSLVPSERKTWKAHNRGTPKVSRGIIEYWLWLEIFVTAR